MHTNLSGSGAECVQALGCVPAVSGYFKAVKAVCEKYGALLILDGLFPPVQDSDSGTDDE